MMKLCQQNPLRSTCKPLRQLSKKKKSQLRSLHHNNVDVSFHYFLVTLYCRFKANQNPPKLYYHRNHRDFNVRIKGSGIQKPLFLWLDNVTNTILYWFNFESIVTCCLTSSLIRQSISVASVHLRYHMHDVFGAKATKNV